METTDIVLFVRYRYNNLMGIKRNNYSEGKEVMRYLEGNSGEDLSSHLKENKKNQFECFFRRTVVDVRFIHHMIFFVSIS